ncbi:16S rRNA processing protein RimM [Hyphomicrobium methylovorum]|uniref:ribosome maturation factor RimM n=1 Tax=Hyphomicrobium methylovorum TaxID=84 RepID=UPI0015E7A1F8|nr:ribosome maturation factor RimM [Hyphomicrobium methylovorum]MBA2126167.1 16S rRNA processing protein RimM [Hyphomicrobium methylovorum]
MANEQKAKLILLGEITGVHGIRGDLMVRSYTDPLDAIATYGPLLDGMGNKKLSLTVHRVTDKGIVARVEGIKDRTAAEGLRGTKLYVERSQLPEASASEFYHADLIGLKALNPDGSALGEIVSMQNFGGGDLLELKPASGAPSEFIPFETQWVPTIDLEQRTAVIIIPTTTGNDENDEGEVDASSDDEN